MSLEVGIKSPTVFAKMAELCGNGAASLCNIRTYDSRDSKG